MADTAEKHDCVKDLPKMIYKEREENERLKKHNVDLSAMLAELKAEADRLRKENESLKAEKASLDLLYAGRGGMIEAYEYALDAIGGLHKKC